MFDEMRPFMVEAGELDDAREAIYTRGDGECPAGHQPPDPHDAVG
jgi:hypothetical protein